MLILFAIYVDQSNQTSTNFEANNVKKLQFLNYKNLYKIYDAEMQ